MSRPLRIEFEGALYHITARGNEKKSIFLDDWDRKKFKEIIQKVLKQSGAIVHCYVLMFNHYHLLLETPRGNLSEVMHELNTTYTVYFNRRHNRVGHLFQGRFKAILVEKESYLLELSRYIHLNPVRAGLVKYSEDYKWSSYPVYLEIVEKEGWVERNWILNQFNSTNRKSVEIYKKFVEVGATFQLESPLKDVYAQVILGKEEFIEKIKVFVNDSNNNSRDKNIPSLKIINNLREINLDDITEVMNKFYKIDIKEVVMKKTHPNIYRQIAIYLIRRHSDEKTRKIGEYFGGIGESAVGIAFKRIRCKREKDKNFDEEIRNIEELLNVET